MPDTSGDSSVGVGAPAKRSASADVPRREDTHHFVHCCCEPTSTLSKLLARSHSVSDITKEVDFTRDDTVERVLRSIVGRGDVFFYSSPCTGGSAGQRVNAAHASRSDNQSFTQ
eukprot:3219819-Alexandrium_andersonii.AAC.1